MAVWVVRAGKDGVQEELALQEGVITIDFREVDDLSSLKSKEELRNLIAKQFPEASPARVSNILGQLWAFRSTINIGDLVCLPLKSRSAIAFGEVSGEYTYKPSFPVGARHIRAVKWLNIDVPRSAVGQDLLYSMGALSTVFSVTRNNAESRLRQLLANGSDPSFSSGKSDDIDETGPTDGINIQDFALDQLRGYINAKFQGHEFTRLVEGVLKVHGYQTYRMPPGPDGGVDILAGQGTMGFDGARLAVQVKGGNSPESVNTLRELQGVMKNFGAQLGLLVSWGGFKTSVYQEARKVFFEIRLWDADEFLRALLACYDQLDDGLQAELPLKRIWILATEE